MTELKDKLMQKVEADEVKMRSRSFFVFTKAIVEVVLFALFILVIYLINLSIYLPKRGLGPVGGGFRWNMLVDVVPWNYLLIGALGLGIAFWILYRFTGTYKKHFLIVVTVISVLVLLASGILAFSNLNEKIENKQPLRGIYMMDRPGVGPRDGFGPGMRNLK
jgi:hypothetical protein